MDKRVYQIATDFAQKVRSLHPVKNIYLYGSNVKGEAHKNSDIDIAVVVENIDDDEYFKLNGELFDVAADYHSNIEPNLLVDDGEYDKYSFLSEVIESGILL
jgi:predicted nucleotidyltransferase